MKYHDERTSRERRLVQHSKLDSKWQSREIVQDGCCDRQSFSYLIMFLIFTKIQHISMQIVHIICAPVMTLCLVSSHFTLEGILIFNNTLAQYCAYLFVHVYNGLIFINFWLSFPLKHPFGFIWVTTHVFISYTYLCF